MTYAERVAALLLSHDNGAMVALAVEMAGRLDTITADDMARRAKEAEKKRRQRMSPGHQGTSGDIGGQTGTSGDIAAPLPLASPTPTTKTTTTTTTTATTDSPTESAPDKPSRSASRRGRSELRSSAVRQTWLSPSAEVWAGRVGAFPFGEAGRFLKPLLDAGLSPDEIATRLTAYLDELEDNGDYHFVSLARFAKTHLRYANGKPLTAADQEYAKIAAEASDVGRMSA